MKCFNIRNGNITDIDDSNIKKTKANFEIENYQFIINDGDSKYNCSINAIDYNRKAEIFYIRNRNDEVEIERLSRYIDIGLFCITTKNNKTVYIYIDNIRGGYIGVDNT